MLSMASYILVFIATSSLAFAVDGKKCSYRPIKSQLEILGFDLTKDSKKFDLSSDFTKDVDSLAEKYSKEDPEYVSATKKIDDYLSATKNLDEQIDHVEELRNKLMALDSKIPWLVPSENNQNKNDPSLAKAIKERDSLRVEINKASRNILSEYEPFIRGDSYNYCNSISGRHTKYYTSFALTQRKLFSAFGNFVVPEKKVPPQKYNPKTYHPQDEFCDKISNALKHIAKVSRSSEDKAFKTVMNPLTDSPHGNEFINLFDYKKAAPFDSVEKVTGKDGRSLWLVKYRGEIKTAYLIAEEKRGQISAQELLISPTNCTLSIGEWKIDKSSKISNLSYEVSEDLCKAVREETKLSPFSWNFYDRHDHDSVSQQAACSIQGGNTVGAKCICSKSNTAIFPDKETCLEKRKITPAIKLMEKIWATETRNYNLTEFKKNKEQIFKSCDTHFPSQSPSPTTSGTPSGRR